MSCVKELEALEVAIWLEPKKKARYGIYHIVDHKWKVQYIGKNNR